MTTIPLPQGAPSRLLAVAALACSLTLGSYLAVLKLGSVSVREAERSAPASVKTLRAAALENDCMNKVVTQRVKDHKVPSPLELDALRASCGLPARS